EDVLGGHLIAPGDLPPPSSSRNARTRRSMRRGCKAAWCVPSSPAAPSTNTSEAPAHLARRCRTVTGVAGRSIARGADTGETAMMPTGVVKRAGTIHAAVVQPVALAGLRRSIGVRLSLRLDPVRTDPD